VQRAWGSCSLSEAGTPGGVVRSIFLLCLEIDVKFFAGSAEVSNLFRLVEILRNLFQRLVEFGIGQAERAQIGWIALHPARRRWSTCQCGPAQDRGHEKHRQQNCSHAKSTFLELDPRGVLCLRVVEGLNTSRCLSQTRMRLAFTYRARRFSCFAWGWR